MDAKKRITVLGIGNILQRDEGVGVRVVQDLIERYDFPENVDVVDGGVLGLSLMSVIETTDVLIVADAVKLGGKPGDLFRMPWSEITERTRYKDSLHQIDFIETMALVTLIGDQPDTVVIGVQPEDIETWTLELSPVVAARVPDLLNMVLGELESWGIIPELKEEPEDVFGRTRPLA